MSGYDYFSKVLSTKGLRPIDVSKATGIRSGVFSDWKAGRYIPKADKMKLIADYLGVPVESLLEVQNSGHQVGYYIDEEAAQYGQAIFEDPDLRALFDAVQGIRKEDMRLMVDMAKRFKETNPDG